MADGRSILVLEEVLQWKTTHRAQQTAEYEQVEDVDSCSGVPMQELGMARELMGLGAHPEVMLEVAVSKAARLAGVLAHPSWTESRPASLGRRCPLPGRLMPQTPPAATCGPGLRHDDHEAVLAQDL